MRLETIPQGEGIKVVIGTRTFLGTDWLHCDIDPTPLYDPKTGKTYPVDILSDARHINLPNDYADIVYNSEALEHFPYKETRDVLREWCRIVKPGGMIRVEVPDFLLACKQVLEWDSLEGDRAMQQIFFAEQLNEFDFHYAGLTPRMLTDDFGALGFEVEDVKRGDDWGWLKVDARKPV